MLEANYLTILLKPNYADPIDTVEDVLDRGLPPLFDFFLEGTRQRMLQSESSMIRTLAERTVVAKVIFCFIERFSFQF